LKQNGAAYTRILWKKFIRGQINFTEFEPVNSKENAFECEGEGHLFMKTFSHIRQGDAA
jgi:hypothetical protein